MLNTATLPAASPSSASLLSSTWFALCQPQAWLPSLARTSILAFLERAVQVGYLEIKDGRETHRFGTYSNECNSVHVSVAHPNFWQRVFVSGDLGFSEAYMMGEVNIVDDNLKGIMDVWLENESTMKGLSSTFDRITSTLSAWSTAFLGQTVSRARLNAMAAYDQSNELFKAFLSNEMMYSCALWGPEEGGVGGDLEIAPSTESSPSSSTATLVTELPLYCAGALEAAQHRKIHHVLKRLRLQRGQRLLEFGSGWGGLAIEAAKTYGVEIDTLTLSVEQKRLAEERIAAAGLEGQIRVHLMDYRELPDHWSGLFDAFVSVEMIEHVGAKHYGTYFSIVDRALKKSNATAIVCSSTFPESRYSTYQAEDFMRRYMWPNSSLPSASVLITAAQQASQSRFSLDAVENHSAHYPRTLREWGRRLEANLTPAALGLASTPTTAAHKVRAVLAPKVEAASAGPTAEQCDATLLQYLPSPADEHARAADFEAIKRKWQYLFAYAAAGFTKGYITCHMLTFVRSTDAPAACS